MNIYVEMNFVYSILTAYPPLLLNTLILRVWYLLILGVSYLLPPPDSVSMVLTASPFSLETTLLSFMSHLLPRIILSTSCEACCKTEYNTKIEQILKWPMHYSLIFYHLCQAS